MGERQSREVRLPLKGGKRVKEKGPVNQCGLGGSYCSAPLHSRGSRLEKAACLFKGTGSWCEGREWRREGGGGSASSNTAQQPNREEAPHTHTCKTARKQDYYFILFVLDYSLRFALQDLIPPGVASFYLQPPDEKTGIFTVCTGAQDQGCCA